MTLFIRVNPSDELPVYRQLIQQVKDAIGTGQLKPGDRLPGHKELAVQLVIAPMTVKKAYDYLKQESLIVMSSGKGTFVSDQVQAISQEVKMKRIQQKIRQLLIEASSLDVSLATVEKQIQSEYEKLEQEKKEKGSL